MSTRSLVVVLVAFALTRGALLWAATHPDAYAPGGAPFLADVDLFHGYATQIVDDDRAPYADVAVEYPPGVLPAIVVPELLGPDTTSYRQRFVATMFLVDLAGLVGLLLVAARRGSPSGVWLWVVLLPLIGPLVYARLDLVPAVATIWAVERASARSSFGAGAALGFGALAKLYPVLLLPPALLAAGRRGRFVAGAVLVVLLPLLPLAGALPELWRHAVADQLGRGIHLESTWGSVLLLGGWLGHPTDIAASFATLHFEGPLPDALRVLSALLTAAVIAASGWLAPRGGDHDRAAWMAAVLFAALATTLGVAALFSPQYVIWLVGLGAAAACTRRPVIGPAVWTLVPVAAATQLVYPFLYAGILASELPALVLLLGRNLLVLGSGALGFRALVRHAG